MRKEIQRVSFFLYTSIYIYLFLMDRVSGCFFCEQEKSAGVQEGDVCEGFSYGIV